MKKVFISFLILGLNLFSSEQLFQSRAVVQSDDRTVLSSELGGTIISISKNNGDYFKKGDILVRLDCDIFKAEMEKIAVKKNLSNVKLNKNVQLQKFNSVGQFDIEISKLELQENEIAYKIASINVNRCEVKAPFSGRVIQRIASRYQNVKPQDQLIEIVNSESLELKSVVPATWLSWLKVGQELVFKVDEIDKEIKTKVLQIDSVVEPKSQTINIRAKIENTENMIVGMSGTLYFSNVSEKK